MTTLRSRFARRVRYAIGVTELQRHIDGLTERLATSSEPVAAGIARTEFLANVAIMGPTHDAIMVLTRRCNTCCDCSTGT